MEKLVLALPALAEIRSHVRNQRHDKQVMLHGVAEESRCVDEHVIEGMGVWLIRAFDEARLLGEK